MPEMALATDRPPQNPWAKSAILGRWWKLGENPSTASRGIPYSLNVFGGLQNVLGALKRLASPSDLHLEHEPLKTQKRPVTRLTVLSEVNTLIPSLSSPVLKLTSVLGTSNRSLSSCPLKSLTESPQNNSVRSLNITHPTCTRNGLFQRLEVVPRWIHSESED